MPPLTSAILADRYRIERELGQGGMATVYLARDLKHDRAVALKVLRPELAAMLGAERFLHEISTTANLQHPHILPLYDSGQSDGPLFYVMPYVAGESLRARLSREKQLGLEESLTITRQVAEALDYAHRQGVIHRDIKPENILLHEGNAMLADFGIALAVRQAGGQRLTESGLSLGTPQYMSPEQATGGRELDARSDVYSLGAVLYEMLAGDPPHTGATVQTVIAKLMTERPTRLRVVRDTVPEGVDAAVARALSKVPADRFSSAGEFARELSTTPSRLTVGRPRRRAWKTVGWIAAGLILLAAGILLAGRLRRQGPPRGIDPRQSLLIGLFDNTRRDPSLEWLRLGGVELLSRALARWQDLDIMPPERLLELTRGAGLSETAPMTRVEALRLARQGGVWTASVGSFLPERDSLQITLRIYDVASGRQIGQASATAADDSALPAAFASLANQVLDLAQVPEAALSESELPTRSIVAWKAYARGLWHAAHIQDSALILFHQAHVADPRFALAYQAEATALLGRRGPFGTDTMPATLAESAWKYSSERPEKERLYIQGFWHLMHGRFPEARAAYTELLSRDSSRADAWLWAAIAARNDLTLRKGADGRPTFPADPTFALRASHRAIALDRNNSLGYFMLTLTLSELADSGIGALPAFAKTAKSFIGRSFLEARPRDTVRLYRFILIRDSVAVWPADSFNATPAQVRTSQTAAAAELGELLARWVSSMPDNSTAWWWWAREAERERRWDDALTGYTRAERLHDRAATAYDRIAVLLGAHRLPEAARLADSLGADSTVLRHPGRGYWFPVAVAANAWMASGRMREALALRRQQDTVASRTFSLSEDFRRYHRALDTLRQMGSTIWAERAVPADLSRFEAELRSLLDHTADTLKAMQLQDAFPTLGFLAAQLGDTVWFKRWRYETAGPDRFPGLDAWARARAGDRAGAERALARVAQNGSLLSPANEYGAGRAAELLGEPQQALRFYGQVDSSVSVRSVTTDWILLVRSWKARADVYRAIGDTANERLYYGRVVEAWDRPDPLLLPERADAARRLAELERVDRRDR
jgi:tetratricopeptide (TPR) repeat protein